MRPHCPSRENFALWKLLENVQHRAALDGIKRCETVESQFLESSL